MTGKEVVANYIHMMSHRKNEPFVAINCAAIPENMLEASLFGYEKGSFTGAYSASVGKFEQAQNGTIFLDEISEMPLHLQVKLLRVLQEKEIERLGAKKSTPLNIRIIAASNRNLLQAIQLGTFREDLYYRLSIFPITIPPLRERKEDILPLAHNFLAQYAHLHNKPVPILTPECQDFLLQQRFPGNVRELSNMMQRALILHENEEINQDDLQLTQVQYDIQEGVL